MSISRTLWEMRREHPFFVGLSLVTVTAMVCWPLAETLMRRYDVVHVSPYGFNDFGAYYRAVDNWLSGDAPIYTEADDGGFHGSYLYPPYVLPLFYPFAQLGFHTGSVLFGVFSLVLLWVGIEAVVEELGYGLAVPERIVLMLALFGFHPALWDFKWGQVSTLLAALLCFAFYAHERGEKGRVGSQYLSGILTTLGASVKLFYAPAGAHMLRSGRRFLAGIATGVGLLAASVLAFGTETYRLYYNVLRWGKGWGTEQRPPVDYQTAYYRPIYAIEQILEAVGLSLPSVWVILATGIGIIGVVGLVIATRTIPEAAHLTFALGVSVVPLFAPRAYTHDLVILLLPALVLLAGELRREDGLPWIPVLAVLLLHTHTYGTRAMIHLFGGSTAAIVQPGVWGTYLLVALAAGRLLELLSARRAEDIGSE